MGAAETLPPKPQVSFQGLLHSITFYVISYRSDLAAAKALERSHFIARIINECGPSKEQNEHG
jgi:hypothetical protein